MVEIERDNGLVDTVGTITILGPMTGIEEFNYPAFFKAEEWWASRGWNVLNPARTFDGDTTQGKHLYMAVNLQNILNSKAVVLLDGWAQSVGARQELVVAGAIGLDIYEQAVVTNLSGPLATRSRPTNVVAAREGFTHVTAKEHTQSMNELTAALNEAQGNAGGDPFKRELAEIADLHDTKKSDYTGGDSHPLSNYQFSSNFVGVSAFEGMMMRMQEKMMRLQSLIRKVKEGGGVAVSDESVADTCRDISIIATLMGLNCKSPDYMTDDNPFRKASTEAVA
jgi:hypothetical protein